MRPATKRGRRSSTASFPSSSGAVGSSWMRHFFARGSGDREAVAGAQTAASSGTTSSRRSSRSTARFDAGTPRRAALAARTAPVMLWRGAFRPLTNSKVESAFADYRRYFFRGKEVDQQVHLGFDLARTANVPILAANHGKVLYAAYLGIYGNTVILDHGQGLQSLYAHMSAIGVSEGQDVRQDQTIGHSGQTGLAGGDHLHFSMLVLAASWTRPNGGIPLDRGSHPAEASRAGAQPRQSKRRRSGSSATRAVLGPGLARATAVLWQNPSQRPGGTHWSRWQSAWSLSRPWASCSFGPSGTRAPAEFATHGNGTVVIERNTTPTGAARARPVQGLVTSLPADLRANHDLDPVPATALLPWCCTAGSSGPSRGGLPGAGGGRALRAPGALRRAELSGAATAGRRPRAAPALLCDRRSPPVHQISRRPEADARRARDGPGCVRPGGHLTGDLHRWVWPRVIPVAPAQSRCERVHRAGKGAIGGHQGCAASSSLPP